MILLSLLFVLRLKFVRFSVSEFDLLLIKSSGEITILFLNFILFVMIRFFFGI